VLRTHFKNVFWNIEWQSSREKAQVLPAIIYRFESTRPEEDLQRIIGIVRDALREEGVDLKI
jgi:hypothetical protein